MLRGCSGEQFKFENAQQSLESLATRDFSASGLGNRSLRTIKWVKLNQSVLSTHHLQYILFSFSNEFAGSKRAVGEVRVSKREFRMS
ncbi:hypothetical protein HRI_001192300 [Hibiscus trionum]|uniref:Uncharacterized protein n=1 Tax=Hibiscus trionum TaxID=183268 RepID=A0A9W7LU17_HIBTR|nr:hypothetical protein HRI_001192300 [Hibiscus trionum]